MAAEVKKVDANDLTKLSIDLAVGQGPWNQAVGCWAEGLSHRHLWFGFRGVMEVEGLELLNSNSLHQFLENHFLLMTLVIGNKYLAVE